MNFMIAGKHLMISICMVVCYFATAIVNAAPMGCSKPADIGQALNEIRSNYIVAELKLPSMKMLKTEAGLRNTVEVTGCRYRFVETKKNPDQFPQSLLTAECERSLFGFCDPRCRPITYMVTVLRREPSCNDAVGQRVWSTKQVNINVGYQMHSLS